jgi:hypothetical protein
VRRLEGSIVKIPFASNKVAFGLVLREPLVAIFDQQFDMGEVPDLSTLVVSPVAFELMVMNYAITQGRWVVVGRVSIPDNLRSPPAFCKQDLFTGKLSIYQEVDELAPLYERDATLDECRGLETAAVWDPEHVEDRIRDHFAGRPNAWVEQLRIWPTSPQTTRSH